MQRQAMPQSDSANGPSILCLPPELVDRILSFSVPCGDERYWNSVKPVPPDVLDWFTDWKERCFAIRLTCHAFALALAPKRALFHSFYWFPTPVSLDRLDKVAAQFPELVRAVSFYPPMFGYREPDYSKYLSQLEAERNRRYHMQWRECDEDYLGRLVNFGDDDQMHQSYAKLREHMKRQSRILKSEHTTVRMIRALRQLTHARRFAYCTAGTMSPEPVEYETSRPRDLTAPTRFKLISKYYPEVLLENATGGYMVDDPHIGGFAKAVNVLWAAGIQPEDFVMSSATSRPDTISTYRYVPDLTYMRRLTIEYCGHPAGANWFHSFAKNGRLFRNLEELRLGRNCESLLSPPPNPASLMPYLKDLKALWLTGFYDDDGSLPRVLKRVPTLEQLQLNGVSALRAMSDSESCRGPWPVIFDHMRLGGITQYELLDLMTFVDSGNEDDNIAHLKGDEAHNQKVLEQLYAYIAGSGEWTTLLTQEWA